MRSQLKGLTGEAKTAKFQELRAKQKEALIRMARDMSPLPKTSSPGLSSNDLVVTLKAMAKEMELPYENYEPPPYDHSINNFEDSSPPPAYDSEPKNDEENGEVTTPPPFSNPQLVQTSKILNRMQCKMDEYNGTMTTPPPYNSTTQRKMNEYNGTMTTPPPYNSTTQPKIDVDSGEVPSYNSKPQSKVSRSRDPQRKSSGKCLIS